MQSNYYVATTRKLFSDNAAVAIDAKVKDIDPSMEFVGPVSIPGNQLHGWIARPNDGNNDYGYQRKLNTAAAAVLSAAEQADDDEPLD